jgi:DNA-directed RNA polymerase specialized sigma24 family protein
VSMQDPTVELEASLLTRTMPDDYSAYDKAWATALVRRTWEQLRQAFIAEGREQLFDELKVLVLGGADQATSQEDVAIRLNIPPATLRTQLHRIRQRYRNFLRDEVARTVSSSADVDEEMSYLFRLLTS